jgi:hypothetical protein
VEDGVNGLVASFVYHLLNELEVKGSIMARALKCIAKSAHTKENPFGSVLEGLTSTSDSIQK